MTGLGLDAATRSTYPMVKFAIDEIVGRRLLDEPDAWRTLEVIYHEPRVERVFVDLDDVHRASLHVIHPCDPEKALLHPHERESEMLVLAGAYRMLIGSSPGTRTPSPVMDLTALAAPRRPFTYAMRNRNGWHAVIPIDGPVYSLFVTGRKWEGRAMPVATNDAKGTSPELTHQRRLDILDDFRSLFRSHLPTR